MSTELTALFDIAFRLVSMLDGVICGRKGGVSVLLHRCCVLYKHAFIHLLFYLVLDCILSLLPVFLFILMLWWKVLYVLCFVLVMGA